MLPSRIVIGTEIHSFLLKAKGGVDLHPMQELIWTKVSYVLGNMHPLISEISHNEELHIHKQFFDYLWGFSLSDMVNAMGDNIPTLDGFTDLARYTNEKNAEHKDQIRSFSQAYSIELRGSIEAVGDIAADIIHQLAEKDAGYQLSTTSSERATVVNMCRNLLLHGFNKYSLRSLHIGVSIHAAMRWDKNRKFKTNDYYDFEHAIAALSYCNAFLTERPLRDLVTRSDINLQAINSCHVFSDIKSASEHIKELLQTRCGG